MAFNLADALKSADILKDAVKSDPEFQKHVTGNSHTRSRSRSRGKSRGRSRAKSRVRSRSRERSRSRGRSKSRVRGKSRARSKSRAGSRSRARSRSRVHSRSRSKDRSRKSHVRSKSRARRSNSRSSSSSEKSWGKNNKRKKSPSPSCNSFVSRSDNVAGNSLLEGLKLVMNSKELEERLPTIKDAILTIQTSDVTTNSVPEDHRPHRGSILDNSTSLESDCTLLPHDRVGSDFSWLQAQNPKDSAIQKAEELEDEESFLYGNEDKAGQLGNSTCTALLPAFVNLNQLQGKGSQAADSKHGHGSFGDLKQDTRVNLSNLASANLDSAECEKIKNILKSLGTTDISGFMGKMQGQKEEKPPSVPASDPKAAGLALPALGNPNVRQALESLQSLIKATKEKRVMGDCSATSLPPSDKHKMSDNDDRKRDKQARMAKMETLMKELEGLLKHDGLPFLTPVIGFYCQKCEEFIGDLTTAENHAALHRHNNSSSMERCAGPGSEQPVRSSNGSSNQHTHSSDRRDHRDHRNHRDPGDHRNHRDPGDHRNHRDPGDHRNHRDPGDHRNHRDHHRDWREGKDHKSKDHEEHRGHRAGHEHMYLMEEMGKERMLITLSRGLTPPKNIRVKEEAEKDQDSTAKVKVQDTDGKGNSSKERSEKSKEVKDESSDSCDVDQGKKSKKKSPKKKKKKEKKKKKSKGDKS